MALQDDRWIIVSGAGGVLGGALTAHYASQGQRVLALDLRFGNELKAGATLTTRTVDLLHENEVRQVLTETIGTSDKIALLINAVGQIWNEPVLAFRGSKLATHSLDTWRQVHDANLTAPFVLATQVAAFMVRRGGGAIVNFSSIASDGNPGQAAYSAAKAGIEGLTRTMADELGPLGVRVNAVSLGFVDGASTRDAVPADKLKGYVDRTPVGRLGAIEDVIGAVDFLASNTFVNGTIVKVDGGLRL